MKSNFIGIHLLENKKAILILANNIGTSDNLNELFLSNWALSGWSNFIFFKKHCYHEVVLKGSKRYLSSYVKTRLINEASSYKDDDSLKDSPIAKDIIKRVAQGQKFNISKIAHDYKVSFVEAGQLHNNLIEIEENKESLNKEELAFKNEELCRAILNDNFLFDYLSKLLLKRGNNLEDMIISILSDYVHDYELMNDPSVKDLINDIEKGNIDKETINIGKIQIHLRVGFLKAERIYNLLLMKGYLNKDK